MSVWLAGYTRVDLGPDGGPFDRSDNPKLCWHTTEGASLGGAEAAFADYPPHLGVDPATGARHQYVSLDRHAYSIKGSDTEDSLVIQVEVVGYAGASHTWPASVLRWLGENVAGPVAAAVGVPAVIAPQGFHGADEGIVLASPTSPIRFPSVGDWDRFAGHVGHQHAPAPDAHWDPGRLDLASILRYAGGAGADLAAEVPPMFVKDPSGVIFLVSGSLVAAIGNLADLGELQAAAADPGHIADVSAATVQTLLEASTSRSE